MNNGEIDICAAPVIDEELKRRIDIANKRIKMLMDEMKKIFAPHMLLTFFVRDPLDPKCFSLLTEETDLQDVIQYMSNLPKPEAIPQEKVGNA